MDHRSHVPASSEDDLSPYRRYTREEWAKLRADAPMTLTADEVMQLQSLNDPISLDEVAAIYLPRYETRDVPADAPPLWVSAAMNDPLGVQGSFKITEMWQQAKRPVELHLYEGGSHGYGMNTTGTSTDRWIEQLGAWLRMHKLL